MASPLDRDAQTTETPRATFSDKERYEWIRGHRGDPVIDSALCNSNFDADFDRHIDEAIERSRSGRRQPVVGPAAEGPGTAARRRGEIANKAPMPLRVTRRVPPLDPDDAAADWTAGRMQQDSKLH